MKYYFGYKYLKFNLNNKDFIIELAYDNTFGKGSFLAGTNILFLDEDETFGHATGIGKDESSAFNMCIQEIENYLASELDQRVEFENIQFEEIEMPKRMTVLDGMNDTTFYIKDFSDNIQVLTDSGVYRFSKEKTIEKTVEKNLKKLLGSNALNLTKEYLKSHDFYPTFEDTIEKFV